MHVSHYLDLKLIQTPHTHQMIISLNSLICIVRGNFQISLILDHANTTFQSFTQVYSKIYIEDENDTTLEIIFKKI